MTPEKVLNRINKLVDELGTYDLRIKEHESDAQLAARLGFWRPGDDDELIEWRETWDQIYNTLCDARLGVQRGVVDFNAINKMLPSVQGALSNFKRVLNETDQLKAAGRSAARRAYGK